MKSEVRKLSIPAVRKGTKVSVISPASYPQPDRLAKGVEALTALGFLPWVGRHALSKADYYFAGTAQTRLEDLHAAFLDPAVAAIFCSRGGYGCNYLLGGLDLGLVREHPKPLIAHSDMTCMQTWLLDQLGLISFHGPMVAGDFSQPEGVDEASLLAALGGDRWFVGEASGLRVLQPGKATGTLYGGCMTLLVASLGTPYAPQTEGKLLFLEDRDVKPYQLDRLLRQMALAEILGRQRDHFWRDARLPGPGAKARLVGRSHPARVGLLSRAYRHRSALWSRLATQCDPSLWY